MTISKSPSYYVMEVTQMRICIDPGHGGDDLGVQAFGINEKNVNLDIAIKLQQLLEHEGTEVVLTRDKDETLEPAERVKRINLSGADYVISIHCNGGPVSAKGVETVYRHNSQAGKELAESILREISNLGIARRRAYNKLNAKREDYSFVVREAEMTAVLVETAFITNPSDNHLLSRNPFRKKIANAIATGIYNIVQINEQKGSHWALPFFNLIREEGLVQDQHPLEKEVSWGELSMVLARLLEKLRR
jgi:N-acetylmuramoyl-L-alanine amidase